MVKIICGLAVVLGLVATYAETRSKAPIVVLNGDVPDPSCLQTNCPSQ